MEQVSAERNAKRRPWLAALLNFFVPGLGALYCGRTYLALILLLSFVVVYHLAIFVFLFLDVPPFNVIIGLVLVVSLYVFLIIHGIVTARKTNRSGFNRRAYNRWYAYLLSIVVWVYVGTEICPAFGEYEAFSVPTSSMENSLLLGDYIMADMGAYVRQGPDRGDIIIFLYPVDRKTKYLKRCVAGPGDTVSVQDKMLYVNGERFPDRGYALYVDTTISGQQNIQPRRPDGSSSRDNYGPEVMPDDSYFVLGDNRDNSYDSRYFGPVARDLILGKLVRVHWSIHFDRVGISVD